MIAAVYRFAAVACAGVVGRYPALEPAFLTLGRRVWSQPGLGRFYRSVADRVAARLRDGDRRFRPVTVGGATLIVDVTEFTTRTLHFGGAPYEPGTTAFLARRLAPGGVFVDVGANHGYFTLVAAALVGPAGRVVAFEPNPTVRDQLDTHLRLNQFAKRVRVHRAALGRRPAASAPLFVSRHPGNSGLASLQPADALVAQGWLGRDHSVDVSVDTLDRCLAEDGVARVDVLKIDVEGTEDDVLEGGAAALRSGAIGAVICETEWDGAAHRRLCALGYTPQLLDPMGERSNIAYTRGGAAG